METQEMRGIGALMDSSVPDAARWRKLEALWHRLPDLGRVKGQTLAIFR